MTKNLSPQTKYTIAKSIYDELIKWKNVAGMSYLQMGRLLKKIKEERLYKNLGEESPEYETLEQFLTMPEINIKLRKAYDLIQIYDTYVEQLKFKPEELAGVSWTALRSLLPCIREENSRDLVEKAKILTRSDLDKEIYQLRLGIKTPETCVHTYEEIKFWRCTKCHETSKFKPTDGKILSS